MMTPDAYAKETRLVNKIGLPVAITYVEEGGGRSTRFCWTIEDAEKFLETTKFLSPGAKISIKKLHGAGHE